VLHSIGGAARKALRLGLGGARQRQPTNAQAVLNVINCRSRPRRSNVSLPTERADRPFSELKDLLSCERHAATVGAMKLGSDPRVVPLAQQSDLKLRLAEQLIPTEHSLIFCANRASPARCFQLTGIRVSVFDWKILK